MKLKNHYFELALIFALVVFLTVPRIFPLRNKPAVTTQFPNRVQEVLPSVVHIMCDRWQGSGVAITEDIIVTARHVIDGENYIITTHSGCKAKGIQAIYHKDYDVGFIKIDRRCIAEINEHEPSWSNGRIFGLEHLVSLEPAKFGSIKECVLGQPVFIIGSPYGNFNFNNVTLGIISGLDRDWEDLSRGEPYGWKVAFTSDSAAHPGNSGGPVFSMDGVVRGLLVGGFSPVLNCSMPCDLFLGDVEVIKLMFAFNKYRVEKAKVHQEWNGYNQK